MSLTCGCAPKWLTSASQPVTAEDAVAARCVGGSAGYVDEARTRAFVDVCAGRLEVQRALL